MFHLSATYLRINKACHSFATSLQVRTFKSIFECGLAGWLWGDFADGLSGALLETSETSAVLAVFSNRTLTDADPVTELCPDTDPILFFISLPDVLKPSQADQVDFQVFLLFQIRFFDPMFRPGKSSLCDP